MKSMTSTGALCALLVLAVPSSPIQNAQPADFERFGPAYQFVFFATLEGLYQDGVMQGDVKRVLMKRSEEHGYEHFIYGCPICTAVYLACETYMSRPKFGMYKPITQPDHQVTHWTFGHGLSQDMRDGLSSGDVKVRLQTLHGLVLTWIDRRIVAMSLTEEKKLALHEQIEAGRKEGEKALARHKQDPKSMKWYAPGYADLYGCALCNAACRIDFEEILQEDAAKGPQN